MEFEEVLVAACEVELLAREVEWNRCVTDVACVHTGEPAKGDK
jgi:hypothetical protein